jgi:hypothetical protein
MRARRKGPWKKRSRVFVGVERLVLGAGMTVVAFFIERRLIKAIKKGSVEPAARTAGEPEPSEPGQGHLTTTPQQVADQAGR